MERTIMMHTTLRCPEDTLSTDLCLMKIYYAVWVYNRIPVMQYVLYTIETWFRSIFEPVSETLSNGHVWGCPTYVLEPKLQNPEVKIPKWAPRSRRGVNMGFRKMHSIKVGLVLNLLTGSILPQYYVVFDYMFSTVIISTATDP